MTDPNTTTTPAPITTAPPTTPPADPPGGTPADWTSSLTDGDKGYVQTKGFKDTAAVLDSYRNLEKLIGVKERLVTLPERDDDADGWNKVYTRLGKPEKADGYKIEVPTEGGDPKFAEFAKGMFHEAGLTTKQAAKVVGKWNEFSAAQAKEAASASQVQTETGKQALKTEWGQAYEQNLRIGDEAATKLGIDDATMKKLQDSMGFDGVAKLFHNLGTKVGEDSFVTGDGKGGDFGQLTPAQAISRIAQRKQDPEFSDRYIKGELSAREEMERLHKMAYPTQA